MNEIPQDVLDLMKSVDNLKKLRQTVDSIAIKDWCEQRIRESKKILEERLEEYMEGEE